MSIVCCLTHWAQQSWQISATIRPPMAPGKGCRSKPARVCPQRVQVTSAIPAYRPTRKSTLRAGVLDLGEAQDLEQADVHPPHVEFKPARLELGGAWIRMVVVVQLLATEPDSDRRNVSTLVLHGEVAIPERVPDAVHDSRGPERNPQHLNTPDHRTHEEPEQIHIDTEHDDDAKPVEAIEHVALEPVVRRSLAVLLQDARLPNR